MTAEAQRVSQSPRTHPPRKLRNFLLDPKFQLKYTLMVVAVTVAVAAVLGYYAYDYSTGQTQMLTMERSMKADSGDKETMAFIEAEGHKEDRKVLLAILRRHRRAGAGARHHRHRRHAPPGRPRVSVEAADPRGQREATSTSPAGCASTTSCRTCSRRSRAW